MSYTYVLKLFYVRESSSGIRLRPALLLQQTESPTNLADIIFFEDGDALICWVVDSELLTFEELLNLDSEFRSVNKAQVELNISMDQAVKLVPRLSPQPGNVVPSPELQQKLNAMRLARQSRS